MHVELKPILRMCRNLIIRLFRIFPIRKTVLFESNPDFNDEAYWMCKKFIERNTEYQLYWILQDRTSKTPDGWDIKTIYWYPKSIMEWAKKWYVISTSKIILDSCNFVTKRRKKQFRLFLTHAMTLKNVSSYYKQIGDYDFFNAGSSYFREYYRSIGIKDEKIIYKGLSRNDALMNRSSLFRKSLSIGQDSRMIMWMPTYRQHKLAMNAASIDLKDNNMTGMPILTCITDFRRINEELKNTNTFLIIKPHQSQNLSLLKIGCFSNIIYLTTENLTEMGVQLYEILSEFDALITDYSSIYVDFLLLERPIGLTIDDLDEYSKKVGFAVKNYKRDVKGFNIENTEGFIKFIDLLHKNPEELFTYCENSRQLFHNVQDFTSGDKIYDFIMDKCK